MSDDGKFINVSDVKIDLGNVGDLNKPASALVNRIAESIGGFTTPIYKVLDAYAEAKSNKILANSKIEIAELEQRATYRLSYEEINRQRNIENITLKALPHLREVADAKEIETDWLVYFFDRSRLISDADMQEHLARILAQETNVPGSVSRRSISLMSQLEKHEAELFSRLCRYVVHIDGDLEAIVLVPNLPNSPYDDLDFEKLLHLSHIGLISYDGRSGFSICELKRTENFEYCQQSMIIEFQNNSNSLNMGYVMLTKAGKELARYCEVAPSEEFLQSIITHWVGNGASIYSCLPETKFNV